MLNPDGKESRTMAETERRRLAPDERRQVIIDAAKTLANEGGHIALSARAVAKRCAVPTSVHTVKHYYPNRVALVKATMEREEMIASAARKVLEKRGAGAISPSTVARECVVPTSTSTVRRYYPSKKALIKAARRRPG